MTAERQAGSPIPVTLLTGFLGSGKTTLLNALLRHPGMDRAAVVVNEFGEIGLDHDLIEQSSEATVLLSSGCLCCTVRGDLGNTLADLLARRQAGDIAFDRVLIETTGIADPGPIVQALVLDPALTDDFVLDGVLTTADAAAGPGTLDRHFEAVQQVAMADLLVITKADLCTPSAVARLQDRLRGLNPNATQITADQGRIDPALLFGLAPRPSSTPAQALGWVGDASPPPASALPSLSGLAPSPAGTLALASASMPVSGAASAPVSAPQGHGLFASGTALRGVTPHTGSHDGRITSQSAEIETPIAPIVFDLWLESLMHSAASNILRLKAVVHVEGLDAPFALHGVQHVFHPPVSLPDWPRGDTVSRIVVIGRDLPDGYLEESLQFLRNPPPVTAHHL